MFFFISSPIQILMIVSYRCKIVIALVTGIPNTFGVILNNCNYRKRFKGNKMQLIRLHGRTNFALYRIGLPTFSVHNKGHNILFEAQCHSSVGMMLALWPTENSQRRKVQQAFFESQLNGLIHVFFVSHYLLQLQSLLLGVLEDDLISDR